ncbi:IclR family transcriptional regulator [Diaphorobacter sp. HDW4A]|uniref:IclR family transcriptional regulator n=1 Tax=Diaphorobacter sp. HDW4A TaxID=2714924 RepID=UPI00140C3A2B|nr:IclR family transcriptional regulator [Diaphorobacter sp. HDW4A]QIL79963.1 IclR family transcriptional regulator [Diaphorobacter sp. HDW4A]
MLETMLAADACIDLPPNGMDVPIAQAKGRSRARQVPANSSANDQVCAPTGTRSVERTLAIIKELSCRGEFGWRLTDLAEHVGLDRATCHRILSCLVNEGFAQRYPQDAKYYPGHLLFEMGLALPQYSQLRELAEPRLAHLSLLTGCIASLSLRSGNDLVCVFQQRGNIELAGMMIRVGTRRPLIGAVGGLAMLDALPQVIAQRIIDSNVESEESHRGVRRLEGFERMREHSRERGFAFSAGDLAPGMYALAVPLLDTSAMAVAAVTLTGAALSFSEEAVLKCHAQLLSAKVDLEADFARCFKRH